MYDENIFVKKRYYFASTLQRRDRRRQNLMSIDVRFWRLQTVPALKELTIYIFAV